jgi:hypothetical protein
MTGGPRARNTKRGSEVKRKKDQKERRYRSLFQQKVAQPGLPLKFLALEFKLNYAEVRQRWKRYDAAERDGNEMEMDAACENHSGGHNRALTVEQELVLAEVVRETQPAMTHTQIVDTAIQFHVSAHEDEHATRSHTPFRASGSFITRFKLDHRLSSHRTSLKFKSKVIERDGKSEEDISLDYALEVHSALHEYGPSLVLNADETPVGKIDAPTTAVTTTGSKDPSRIISSEPGLGESITIFPCISADGHKLPLTAVIKGKTPRSFNKITRGASATVNKVHLLLSSSAFMTSSCMVQWLREIVQAYTRSRPAALILDAWKAHWTPEVREVAARMNLELIRVPSGFTSTLQPLDVCFNGPLKRKRQKIWREKKRGDDRVVDNHQASIERQQLAYETISRRNTKRAWEKAQLVFE